MGISKYKKLNDEAWLRQKYIIEELSTIAMAKLAGAKTCNSVRQALIKFNIPVRNFREGQTKGREPNLIIDKQRLDGGLLGDAYMSISNKHGKLCGGVYKRKQQHKEYIDWCAGQLGVGLNIKKACNEITYNGVKKSHIFYEMRTLSSLRLREFYDRWYKPENGFKKAVPRDLEFTKEMLLIWFLDDGSSTWRERDDELKKENKKWSQKTKQVILNFASESFAKEDNQYLCDGFNKAFDLGMKLFPTAKGTGWRIKIPQRNTNKFFETIGECPVDCYKYKWKIV